MSDQGWKTCVQNETERRNGTRGQPNLKIKGGDRLAGKLDAQTQSIKSKRFNGYRQGILGFREQKIV